MTRRFHKETNMVRRIPLTILILGILGAGSDLAMPPRVADPAQTSEQTLVKKYLQGGSADSPSAPCKEIF